MDDTMLGLVVGVGGTLLGMVVAGVAWLLRARTAPVAREAALEREDVTYRAQAARERDVAATAHQEAKAARVELVATAAPGPDRLERIAAEANKRRGR